MSLQNLQFAFRSTEIFPYNPCAIPDTAFAPSSITHRVIPEVPEENRFEKVNWDSDSDIESSDSIESERQ